MNRRKFSSTRYIGTRLLAAVILVSGVAGCSNVDDQSTATTNPSPKASKATASDTDAPAPRLPSQAYLPTQEEKVAVERAFNQLLDACAKRIGASYTSPPVDLTDSGQLRRLWGVMTAADAERFGYHLPLAFEQPDSTGNGQTAEPGTSRSGTNQNSAPPLECLDEANQSLETTHFQPSAAGTVVLVRAFQETQQDPRMQKVFDEWADCMTSKGYDDYSSPLDVLADPGWDDLTEGEPSATEIQTATADIECKVSTDLIQRAFEIESGHEKVLIEQQLRELTEARAQWDAIVERANTTVGSPS